MPDSTQLDARHDRVRDSADPKHAVPTTSFPGLSEPVSIRAHKRPRNHPPGPISTRNPTDLEPEYDRSRGGSEPISTRSTTDLEAE